MEGVLRFVPWTKAVRDYEIHLKASGASKGTVRLRLHHVKAYALLAPAPRLVTTQHLLELLAVDLAPETRASRRASMRRFFGWAYEFEVIETNPALKLPVVKRPEGSPRPAPDDVIVRAICGAEPRVAVMIMFGAYAGLRCCEIARIHVDDISGDSLRVHGKGGRIRTIPLHRRIIEQLGVFDGYLFPGSDDGHLSPLWVCELISRALPPGWTAHKLRHRFASKAYSADRDYIAVKQLLGHAMMETTMRYVAVPNDAIDRAVFAAGPN